MEVVYQFFVGTFDETGTYVDEFQAVARNYAFSYSGFWFDALTSVPWSYLDLYSYQVRVQQICSNSFDVLRLD